MLNPLNNNAATTPRPINSINDEVDMAENAESIISDDTFFTDPNLQTALNFMLWSSKFSGTMGIIAFIYIPACRQALQELRAQAAMPLRQRSIINITANSASLITSSASMINSTTDLIVRTPLTSHVQSVCRAINSYLHIPLCVYHVCRDVKNTLSQFNEFRVSDKYCLIQKCTRSENANPALTFISDMKSKEDYCIKASKTNVLSILRSISIPASLFNMSSLSLLTTLSSFYYSFKPLPTYPNADELKNLDFEYYVPIATSCISMAKALTIDDMKQAIGILGAGSYLSWQMNNSRYSDQEELDFLQYIIGNYIGKKMATNMATNQLDSEQAEKSIFNNENEYDSFLRSVQKSLDNIYVSYQQPKIELSDNLSPHIKIVKDLLNQIWVVRKYDINIATCKRKISIPLGNGSNHIFRNIIAPIFGAHAYAPAHAHAHINVAI